MEGTRFDECDHGILAKVRIEAVDRVNLTFSTRSASNSGDPNECLLRTFTVPLAEVITTQIPGAPEPVAMVPGAVGNLFLSRAGWQTRSSDGFAIHGVEHAVFKWPQCAASPSRVLSMLTVLPTSLIVHGHLEGETEFFELELLGDDAADAQDFAWSGAGFLELKLTHRGAGRLHVKSRSTLAKVWPTRIVVQGSPAMDQAVSGEVDILNLELAGEEQHIVFAKHGAAITLSLTQDGVNAFHVTPQAVAEHASESARTAHAELVRPGAAPTQHKRS